MDVGSKTGYAGRITEGGPGKAKGSMYTLEASRKGARLWVIGCVFFFPLVRIFLCSVTVTAAVFFMGTTERKNHYAR